MGNLSVGDRKSHGNNGSANIKLGPVITRKTLSNNSANSLNTLKRLPPQQPPTKTRSIPITPEKSTVAKKSESSWPVSPARKVILHSTHFVYTKACSFLSHKFLMQSIVLHSVFQSAGGLITAGSNNSNSNSSSNRSSASSNSSAKKVRSSKATK